MLAPPLLVIALLWGCAHTTGAGPAPAPDFALPDLSGGTVRLAQLRGKVVLLDFWATWCDSCRDSMPFFEGLRERYRARGLEVLGVNEDEEAEAARRYARLERPVLYPMLLDARGRVREAYGVRALPSTVLIDRQGRLRARWARLDPAAVEREAARLLD